MFIAMHGTPLTIMLLREVKSAKVNPRSVPVMMMVVPPLGGPEEGETLVMTGRRHCLRMVMTGVKPGHNSSIRHDEDELSHHPHWKFEASLVPTQEEQLLATTLQS